MAPRSIARQAVPRYTPSRYVTCSSGFRDRRRRTTWWNSRACRRAFTRCEPLVALCPNRTGRSSVFASAVLHSSYSLSWRPPWYSVTDGRRPSLWRCGFEKMWKAAGDTGETAAANHVATEWHIFHVTYGYRCTYRSNAHDPVHSSDVSDGGDPRWSSSAGGSIAAIKSGTRSTDSPAPPSIAKVETEGRGFIISGSYSTCVQNSVSDFIRESGYREPVGF